MSQSSARRALPLFALAMLFTMFQAPGSSDSGFLQGSDSGLHRRKIARASVLDELKSGQAQTGPSGAPEASSGLPGPRGVPRRFWVNQAGQISFEVEWDEGDKVKDLKEVVAKVSRIPRDVQELRCRGNPIGPDGQLLEGLDLSDVWVLDTRDEGERPGVFFNDAEEDYAIKWTKAKGFIFGGVALVLTVVLLQASGMYKFDILQDMMKAGQLPVRETPEETRARRIGQLPGKPNPALQYEMRQRVQEQLFQEQKKLDKELAEQIEMNPELKDKLATTQQEKQKLERQILELQLQASDKSGYEKYKLNLEIQKLRTQQEGLGGRTQSTSNQMLS